MTHSNLDLYDVIQQCERFGVRQRVEELCAVAGILIAAQPRNILEIGVYSGGSFALPETKCPPVKSKIPKANGCPLDPIPPN